MCNRVEDLGFLEEYVDEKMGPLVRLKNESCCQVSKNGCSRRVSKMEREIDCVIRLLCAGLVVVMVVVGSASFLTGQIFVNGFILLMSAIILMAMALRYRYIDLVWKAIRVRLKG
jgi:hypothetical protein